MFIAGVRAFPGVARMLFAGVRALIGVARTFIAGVRAFPGMTVGNFRQSFTCLDLDGQMRSSSPRIEGWNQHETNTPMNNETIRNHYDCFDRIKDFGAKYADRFVAGSRAATLFEGITAVAVAMETKGVRKLAGTSGYHGGTHTKRVAAELVKEDLQAIRNTAVAIAEADDLPDFEDEFRLPRQRSYAMLLSAAKTFLQEATPHKALFIEFELPADFLEDLAADIELLENGRDEQHDGLSERVGSTAELTTLALDGMSVRKQLLVMVRNKFKGDSGLLAEWETAAQMVWPVKTKEGVPVSKPMV
jgi:hypothetical protein